MAAQTSARIIVVDDDPGIRELVSGFPRKHGFDVDTAATAPVSAAPFGPPG